MKELNIFNQNQSTITESPKYSLKNLEYEEDPIEIFLNSDAFIDRSDHSKEISAFCGYSQTETIKDEGTMEEIKETEQKTRKKSIFHNFQKHLITLIKKFIRIAKNETWQQSQTDIATALWTVFMKTRSFNKKILHIIFGVSQKCKIGEQSQRLSQQFPQLKALISEAGYDSIALAQQYIRSEFVRQAQQLNKNTLQTNCNVSRFQEFYQYFQSFIGEVRSGPMTKRMTKNRKYGVVTKLAIMENSE